MRLYSECMKLAQESSGNVREQVAEEVRVLMARHRVSANRLAVMTGLTQSSMSRRLAGKYPFTVDELEVIADAFGVGIVELFPTSARSDSNRRPGDYIGEASVTDLTAERRVRRPDIDPLSPVRRTADVLLFRRAPEQLQAAS